MVWITSGVVGIVGLVAIAYLGIPLVILAQFWIKPDAPVEEVDPADLSPTVQDFFATRGEALETLGFAALGTFRTEGMVPNVDSAFRMLAHPEAQTLAMVVWMRPRLPDHVPAEKLPPNLYIEFATETVDGVNINSNNSTTLPSPDCHPDKIIRAFPSVTDARTLWDLHRLLVRELAGTRPLRAIPLDLSPAEMLRREFVQDLEKKAARGYWKRTADGGRFKPSLKGGYVMTWAELPPFKQWRKRRSDRWAAAMLARLDVNA